MRIRSRPNGFTLLEIMIVVTIIALLMGVAINKYVGHLTIARQERVDADASAFKVALKTYEGFNGFYPTTEQGLRALVVQPDTDPKPVRWTKQFDSLPKDPWHNEYMYRCPGSKHPDSYDLFSAGKDRQPGTDDDLWPIED